MLIRVNRERGVPVYLQIIEQVRFLIESGVIQSGQQLPTAQSMARQLGVHINTVSRAYNQLESAGYIVLRQGSGTFVDFSGVDSEVVQSRKQLRAIIEGAIQEAQTLGFSIDEFLGLADLVANTFASPPRKKAAFVECHEAWLNSIARRLGDELEIEVEPVLLGELGRDPALQARLRGIDVIITMVSHVEEVRRILDDGRKVYSIVLYPSVEAVNRLVSSKASRVGVLFLQPDIVERLENSFRSLGLDVKLETVETSDDANLVQRIAQYDAVLVPATGTNRLDIENSPKMIEITSMLARESIEVLKRELADWLGRTQEKPATVKF